MTEIYEEYAMECNKPSSVMYHEKIVCTCTFFYFLKQIATE